MGTDKIQISLILSAVAMIMLVSCDATVAWSGQTYTGTITKDSPKTEYRRFFDADSVYQYYAAYDIGVGGDWTVSVESPDNVNLNIEIKPNGCENVSALLITNTNYKQSFTRHFDTGFRIYIKVTEDDQVWINSNYRAGYTLKVQLN